MNKIKSILFPIGNMQSHGVEKLKLHDLSLKTYGMLKRVMLHYMYTCNCLRSTPSDWGFFH